jgi:hypothetical protein
MAAMIEQAPASEERLRAAIGPRADYYLARWRRIAESGKSHSWNWAACLLSVCWLAYRKLWWPMGLTALAFVAASPFLDPANLLVFRIAAFSLVGLSFVTGGFGNLLYRRRIERLAASPLALEQLRARGGVSLVAAFAALIGVTALSALAGLVFAMLAKGG